MIPTLGKNKLSIEEGNMVRNKQMLFVDFLDTVKITLDVKTKNKSKLFPEEIRIGSGMYCTDKETKKYMENSLRRKLP